MMTIHEEIIEKYLTRFKEVSLYKPLIQIRIQYIRKKEAQTRIMGLMISRCSYQGPFHSFTESASSLDYAPPRYVQEKIWFKETSCESFQEGLLSPTDQVAKPDCVSS